MGFPVELFVDQPVDEELMCSICEDVIQDPAMVDSGCEHVFCRSCINDWNAKLPDKNTCPLDRKPVQAVIEPPRVMVTFLNLLKLHCQFQKLGCDETPTVEGILHHESKCKVNPENYVDCTGGCETKIWKADQETHQCIEHLKQQIRQLKIENTDLKGKCGNDAGAASVAIRNNTVEVGTSMSAEPSQWKPDGTYAVCIFENCGGILHLDLKLGDMIEIEKEMFGQNSHIGVKNGVKGLVAASCVRILTYEKFIAGFEIAQCLAPNTSGPPIIAVPNLSIVQVICKDIPLYRPYGIYDGVQICMVWLVKLQWNFWICRFFLLPNLEII